jgi:hypothetical protein
MNQIRKAHSAKGLASKQKIRYALCTLRYAISEGGFHA